MPRSKPDFASATSPLPISVDPKPLAAAKLGFCSRYLGLDIIEDALSELTDVVQTNVFACLTEAVRQANDDYLAYEAMQKEARLRPPHRVLPDWSGPPSWIQERIRRTAEVAIDSHNPYRRWLDIGVALGATLSSSDSVAATKAVKDAAARFAVDEAEQVPTLVALMTQLENHARVEDAVAAVLASSKKRSSGSLLFNRAASPVVDFFNLLAEDLAGINSRPSSATSGSPEQVVADPGSKSAPSGESNEPAQRLVVDLDQLSAALDGKTYRLKNRYAAIYVKALGEVPGGWLATPDIIERYPEYENARVGRIYDGLPRQIRELIEKRSGGGSRLTLPKLA